MVFHALFRFVFFAHTLCVVQSTSRILVQGADNDTLQCDHDHPCPEGATCMTNPSLPTVRQCYTGITDPRPRAGRCPLASEPQTPCPPIRCNFDQDCPETTARCCGSKKCGRVCRPTISVDPAPMVTVLMNGSSFPTGPKTFQFHGSTALVQSGGKNILWESGGPGLILQMLKALNDLAGLRMCDLDALLVSHGHVDRIGNVGLFVDIPATIGTGPFTTNGSDYVINALESQNRLFFLDDRNLELMMTPGHTLVQFSLIVRNVSAMGTVALVGDVFENRNDKEKWQKSARYGGSIELAAKSRREIICTVGANFILPGHGEMFEVTDATKLSTGVDCSGAGSRSAVLISFLVGIFTVYKYVS